MNIMDELNDSDKSLITNFLKHIILGLFNPYSYLGHQEPMKQIFKHKIMNTSTTLGELHNLLGNNLEDYNYEEYNVNELNNKISEIIPKVISLNKLDLVVAKFKEIQKCKDIPTKEIIEFFLKSKNYKLSDFFNENIANLIYSIHIDNISCNYDIYNYKIYVNYNINYDDYFNKTFGMLFFYWIRDYFKIFDMDSLVRFFNYVSGIIQKQIGKNRNITTYEQFERYFIDYVNTKNLIIFIDNQKKLYGLLTYIRIYYFYQEKTANNVIFNKLKELITNNYVEETALVKNITEATQKKKEFIEELAQLINKQNENYITYNDLDLDKDIFKIIFNNSIIITNVKDWLLVTNYMSPNALHNHIKTGKADDLLRNAIKNNYLDKDIFEIFIDDKNIDDNKKKSK